MAEGGRFRVSIELEMGFEGQPTDDSDYDLDPQADLSVAVAKILEEIRTLSPGQLESDWGLEPGRLMLTVVDVAHNKAHFVNLYWEGGEWREH